MERIDAPSAVSGELVSLAARWAVQAVAKAGSIGNCNHRR
jgi:hypothetical protein